MTKSQGRHLREPRYREDLGWLKCGLVGRERDATGPEACPSYDSGGMWRDRKERGG
jgi:hypothetical protein